jgi:hypothetical protein
MIVLTGKETGMTTVRWCATTYPPRPVPGISFNPRNVFCLGAKGFREPHPVGGLAAECRWHASALPDLEKA